jgi:hypothetical protein
MPNLYKVNLKTKNCYRTIKKHVDKTIAILILVFTKLENFYSINKTNIHKTIIFFFIISFVSALFVLFLKSIGLDTFQTVFKDYVTGPDMLFYLYWGFFFDSMISYFYFIYVFYRRIILERKDENFWLESTILLILLTSIIGVSFLYGFTSHDLSSYLRDARNNTFAGQISCNDTSGHFLTNNLVSCFVTSPYLMNFTANMTFTFSNKTFVTISENSTIVFNSSPDITRIDFTIVGFDNTNNRIDLSTGRNFEFYTINQYNDIKKQTITYLIIIASVILITIPSIMANFKALYKKD